MVSSPTSKAGSRISDRLRRDQHSRNLEHRGAVGADPRAGDGAGILVQIPHVFLARKANELGFTLPRAGEYAVAALFMPRETAWREIIRSIVAHQIKAEGLTLLGWREVPTDNSSLGDTVKPTEPANMQVFIGRNGTAADRGRVRTTALHPAQVNLAGDLSNVASAVSPAIIRCRCRAAP